MSFNPPVKDRVQQSFAKLTSAAASINSASDKFTASITRLEEELRKLGIGVSSAVTFRKVDAPVTPSGIRYVHDELWYAKMNGKWILAIKTRSGDRSRMLEEKVEMWPFGEAPRHLRVLAVDAIPELLEQLTRDAESMATEVQQQKATVDAITEAIFGLAPRPQAPTPGQHALPAPGNLHISPSVMLRAKK